MSVYFWPDNEPVINCKVVSITEAFDGGVKVEIKIAINEGGNGILGGSTCLLCSSEYASRWNVGDIYSIPFHRLSNNFPVHDE